MPSTNKNNKSNSTHGENHNPTNSPSTPTAFSHSQLYLLAVLENYNNYIVRVIIIWPYVMEEFTAGDPICSPD